MTPRHRDGPSWISEGIHLLVTSFIRDHKNSFFHLVVKGCVKLGPLTDQGVGQKVWGKES